MTNTTNYSIRQTDPRIHEVTAEDGSRLGRILTLSTTYRAARRNGTAADIRRVSHGFRTIEAAAAWIARAER